MKISADEKQYRVFNRTDGALADAGSMTLKEAKEFIRRCPARYRRQGYYLTSSQEWISAGCVEWEMVDENLDPVAAGGRDNAPGHAAPPT